MGVGVTKIWLSLFCMLSLSLGACREPANDRDFQMFFGD